MSVLLLAAMGIAIAVVHRRGAAVSALLERTYPEEFQRLGRPRPSYFQPFRNARFDRFILHREYLELEDADLSAACSRQRRATIAVIIVVLATFALLILIR